MLDVTDLTACRRRAAAGLLVAVAGLGLLCGCVSPALSTGQYDRKATLAVQAGAGEVATGALVVQDDLDGKVFGTYADRVVTASESALGSITASFGSVQPPGPADDAVRDAVLDALAAGEDALAEARIAVRRSDREALARALQALHAAAAGLDAVEQRLS